MDIPKLTPKLFLAMYIVILLPLLTLNVLVSQWNLNRVTNREMLYIRTQLTKISDQLTGLQASYAAKANQISSKSALHYRNMVGDFAVAQTGADLLKDIAILDDRTSDFYMYYKTGEVFAARGYSHTNVFFGSQLAASTDTYAVAMDAIESSAFTTILINRNDFSNAYMLLHYPVGFGEQAGITSTGFVFTLSSLMESFPAVTDHAYVLRFSNETTGAPYMLSAGRATALSAAQYADAKKDTSNYEYFCCDNEKLGITVELLYPHEAIAAETRDSVYWNYGMILLGTLVSAITALLLARFSWKKLKEMEDFASGKTDMELPKRNDEYAGLRAILRAQRDESISNRQAAQQIRTDNKAQLMRLLTAGMFRTQAEFSEAAKQCGLMLLQTHYFVIGALMPNPNAVAQLDKLLEHDLTCHITIGERMPAMLFFAELPDADLTLETRIRLVDALKDVMHDHQLPVVQLSFSAVYDALDMAPFAVAEVREMLTRQLETDATADELCATETVPMAPVQLLETSEDALRQLTKALRAQNEPDTLQSIAQLMKPVAVSGVSADNRRYMRYEIQQVLVRQLRDAACADRDRMLAAALALNPADGAQFDRLAARLAQRYCRVAPGVDNIINRVMRYIEQHFTDGTLSADAIADYAGLNKAYLARLFKQKIGMSYVDLVSRLRMERAMQLLKDPTRSVTEVVTAVGYLDESSFRRKFRTVYGVTVTEFRAGKKPEIKL